MILACTGCDSRYDVSGHAPGQQFRCRCGTVLTLQAPSPQAGQLACPHCGGGLPIAASTCEYCNAELLVKSCPRCLTRVFSGYAHCPCCGVALDIAAAAETHPDMPCPRCDTLLAGRLVGDVLIDECGKCHGLFLDHVAIKRVVLDRQQARAESLLGALPKQPIQRLAPSDKMYVKCPMCHVVMNRKQFAAGSGVIIDVCKTHGVFFDGGELPATIEYVMSGGLEKAQQLELERKRDVLRQEVYNAQLERARAASSYGDLQFPQHHHVGLGGSLLGGILASLWS
jgi:Zn-finger nucleic acid-binding protein